MARVVFMDGFDMYDGANNNTRNPGIHSKWIISNNNNIYFSAGRYGGQSIHLGGDVSGNSIRGFFSNNLFLQTATVAFAFSNDNVADMGSNGRIFRFLHNDGEQFGIGVSNIGEVVLYRGSVAVATSIPNLIKTNDWHYIEMEYVGHSSIGRASLYLDGNKVVEFTGNTQNQAPYGFNGIQLSGGWASSFWIDDLYVIDEASRIGERRIDTLRPNGDVTGNSFKAVGGGAINYGMLNDTVVNATTYVSANTLGDKDLYNFDNLTTVPTKIDAVQLSVWAQKTDSDTRQLASIVKSGTFETIGPNVNLPSNHININRIEQVDPATSLEWTAAGVNALQAGFKITK